MDFKSFMPFNFGSPNGKNPLEELQKEMDKLFTEFSKNFNLPAMRVWNPDFPRGFSGLSSPKVDISETDKNLIVRAELPGMEADDIEVTMTKNILTIQGEKRIEKKQEKENYHLIERSSGSFYRSFPLPFESSVDKLEASFKNGVLTIEIPKPKELKSSKQQVKIKNEK